MVGGPGTPALLSGYPSMGGFGTAMPSPGVYYNREYAPSGLTAFPKPGVECSGMKGKGSSCWVDGGYEWRGARQQCANSKSEQDVLRVHLKEYLCCDSNNVTFTNTNLPFLLYSKFM